MIVWLWEAGHGCGVTDSEPRARKAAWSYLEPGGRARVEMARLTIRPDLMPGYERAGIGWTAGHTAGRIAWTPLDEATA